MASALEKEVAEWKTREVESLEKIVNEYRIVGIADLYKVRAIQLQKLKKMFKSDVHLKVTKNSFMRRALEGCKDKKDNIEKLSEHIGGSNVLLFTDMNPFKLSLLLDKSRIKMTAKAGDVAQNDVVISAGNTGMPPGPIISELHEVGIPTKIETGSVWVTKDTVVAKKGSIISPRLASVLSKLGIKPLEVGLNLIAVYDGGLILVRDQLHINLEETKQQIQEAYNNAYKLAINTAYPTSKTISVILLKAATEARSLAIKSTYPAPEVIDNIITIAHNKMLSLASALAKVNKNAVPAELLKAPEVKAKEKVEKEEGKEEKKTEAEKKKEEEEPV